MVQINYFNDPFRNKKLFRFLMIIKMIEPMIELSSVSFTA